MSPFLSPQSNHGFKNSKPLAQNPVGNRASATGFHPRAASRVTKTRRADRAAWLIPPARRGRTIGMYSLDARIGDQLRHPGLREWSGDRPLIGLSPHGTNEGIGSFSKRLLRLTTHFSSLMKNR